MGQVTVDPRSLESAAAVLRGAHDGGMTALARAIVDDLRDDEELTAAGEFSSSLPQLMVELTERATATADHLTVAAHDYRKAEWLVRVALVGQA